MSQRLFQGDGSDFSALYEAQQWLVDNGYSVGPMCHGCPMGIVKGEVFIGKWRSLTREEQRDLDGQLHADRFGTARIVFMDRQRESA